MDYNNVVSSSTSRCGEVDLGIKTSDTKQATVDFKGEACSDVNILEPTMNLSSLHRKQELATVERYLRRPIKLDTWVIDSTTRTYDMNASNFANVSTRLVGALGFRCTLVFRLQIVGTPFTSGIYRLCWTPSVSRYRSDAWGANITMASQIPGVNLNISETTEVVLRVPFNAVTDYLPVKSSEWSTNDIYGTLWVIPFVPANFGSGSVGVRANIWMNYEDIEIEGNVAPVMVSATLQSGISAPATEQQCVDEHGCSATGLPTVKTAVDTVAPSISPLLGAAAWAVKKMSGAASALGYSKPNRLKSFNYVRPTKYFTVNTDVADVIPSTSTHAYNNVSLIPGDGMAVEQMGLLTFASRYAVCGYFTLNTSDAEDYLKYYSHVHPLAGWWSTTASAWNSNRIPTGYTFSSEPEDMIPTPLFYISNLFTMWRGTIKYRFDFAKTKFHAGRIRITYSPSANYLAASAPPYLVPDTSDGTQVHGKTVIWDIRESSYFEFECPYEWHRYYTPFNKVTSSLSVIVVDPLIAADTVANNIRCMVSMAAGSDFEWANACPSQYLPYATTVTAPPSLVFGDDGFPFEDDGTRLLDTVLPYPLDVGKSLDIKFQSGIQTYDCDLTLQDMKGSENAIGESIVSIKDLISRPSWANLPTQGLLSPFYTTGVPSRANIDSFYYSWQGYFNHVFAYARGSTRYQVLSNIPTSKISLVEDSRGIVGTQGNGNASMNMYQADYNLPCQAIAPFMSTNSRTTAGQGVGLNYINYWGERYTNLVVANPASGTTTGGFSGKFLVAVSAGDDAQLFFQLPCPAFKGGFTTVATTASGVIASAFFSAYA